ncbi:MAG TPA: hypothetical protein VGO62_21365, partial [Myxococcota bacterium]
MIAAPLAVALAVASTTTPLAVAHTGPSAGDDARVAIAGDLVVTAAGRRVLVQKPWGGADEATTIPCDAVDLAADERSGGAAWAVLCSDRIVVSRDHALTEIPLEHGEPTAFSFDFSLQRAAVGFQDGAVTSYAIGAHSSKSSRYDQPILSVSLTAVDEVSALTSGPCDECAAASTTLTLHKHDDGLITGALTPGASPRAQRAWVGGRIIDDTKHGGVLLDTDEPVADLDIAFNRVCFTVRTTLTCLTPPAGGTDAKEPPIIALPSQPEQEAPVRYLTLPLVAASAGVLAGVGGLVAAPFLLEGFGVLPPAALPVMALLTLGGAGLALGAVGVVGGVALLIMASVPHEMAGDGSCLGDAVAGAANAFSDCVNAFAVIAGAALALGGAGLGAGGTVALWNAAHVEQATSGRSPRADPFWPALGGSVAGAAVGLGFTVLLSASGSDEQQAGGAQQDVNEAALDTAGVALLLGGAAV